MSIELYLLLIGFITSTLVYIYKKVPKLHKVPLILIIYITFMFLASFSLWETELIHATQKRLISNLLPAMIFLMMLGFNITTFKQLGKKMLLAFFSTTLSIIVAFTTVFFLFKTLLWEDAAQSFAALSGSWSGGSINMVAIAKAMNMSDSLLANVVVVDTIVYSFWLMFLLFLVPFAKRFNNFTKAQSDNFILDLSCCIDTNFRSYVRIIVISLLLAYGINIISYLLPSHTLLTPTFYAVILATTAGFLASKTSLATLPAQSVANSMLYLIIALIASQANFSSSSDILLFTLLAFMILILHAIIILGFAKLFKLDLFSIAVASLAHIGGTAGATVLASSYHKNLIPVAIIMATAGYLVGTFVGLFIAYTLGGFS
jgi:uncharacterized membrane protein